MTELTLPAAVQTAMVRLNNAGFEAYVVGGGVRDQLLGRTPDDWDVTTSATPEETMGVFTGERVFETGIQHGTVTVLIGETPLEITTFRTESGYKDSRHPDRVTFAASVEDDLSRRDFTINAMAYHPSCGLIDRFGGQADLNGKLIRCVGQPEQRFSEDALRILRALRFASELDFAIEPQTAAALCSMRERLSFVSAERIYTEMTRLLLGKGAGRILREFAAVIFTVFPELSDSFHFSQQNPYHIYDVYEHITRTVDAVPADSVLRWAMLFHDAGKPATLTVDAKGIGHFHGHPTHSAALADTALKRFKTDRAIREQAVQLILIHDVKIKTPADVKRLLGQLGTEGFEQLLLIKRADNAAKHPSVLPKCETAEQETRRMMREILQNGDCYRLSELAVNGDDWKAAGLPMGQAVGDGLHRLLNAVIDGTCPNEKAALLKQAAAWYRK